MLLGIGASEGYAIGTIYLWRKNEPAISTELAVSRTKEMKELNRALTITRNQLDELCIQTRNNLGEEDAKVFESHKLMLDDPDYIDMIRQNILEAGMQAPLAIKTAAGFYSDMFEAMDDEYMKARAADINDVANRMIRIIMKADERPKTFPENTILIAYDLTPSDTAQIDKRKVKAFVTEIGSKTSHSAIMARSMRIPAVLGVNGIVKQVKKRLENSPKESLICIVDGFIGKILLNPDQDIIEEYKKKILRYQKELSSLMQYKNLSLSYTSGRKIKVAANIGSLEELKLMREHGAQGIGLLRTEFLFMERNSMPDEEEQMEFYKEAVIQMGEERVIIRTLDVGGDKTISYMNLPKEENPFLGLRALRLCFKETKTFKTQLRAILRASVYGNLAIMFPMIGSIHELQKAKEILKECKEELVQEGIAFCNEIPVGIMIEIPAAAIRAADFAKQVDFFSIGTNDLVQYTLAVDRRNIEVSELYDPYHPAVIALIEMTIRAAHSEGIWCGMCGEMASDIKAVEQLAAMELDEFSVTGSSTILRIKERLTKQHNIKIE